MEIASWFFLRRWQHSKRIERCPSGEKKNESINRYLSPNDRKYSEKSELNSVRLRVWSTWKHVDNRFSDVFFASQNRSIRDGLRPQYPKKNKKKKHLTIKKQHIRERLGRGSLNACAKFQGHSLVNGVDIGLWRNWGFYAWTSVYDRFTCEWSLQRGPRF